MTALYWILIAIHILDVMLVARFDFVPQVLYIWFYSGFTIIFFHILKCTKRKRYKHFKTLKLIKLEYTLDLIGVCHLKFV